MVSINETRQYHRNYPIDLMTEFTICESLASVNSPYMVALEDPKPYGAMVGDMLKAKNMLKTGCRVCEIGGGYGSLMRGLLDAYSSIVDHVYMVDLSMSLLKKQKKILEPWDRLTTFIHADATELIQVISGVDVIILNEVIGDFDTYKDVERTNLPGQVSRLVNQYALDIPDEGSFNFNVGAISIVEEICKKGISVFISEHSSDPIIPRDMEFLEKGLETDSFPREIRLKEHSEFTIRFSHLIKVAKYWERNVSTGSLIDLVGLKKSPKMKFIFISRACATDEHEIIFELLDHIREYRWLIIN